MGATSSSSELERLVSLTAIDELWSGHLAAVNELREGTQWVSYGGREPLYEYLRTVHRLFESLQARITEEIPKRLAEAETRNIDPSQRGATWTYLTTDQPFGSLGERFMSGLMRKARRSPFLGLAGKHGPSHRLMLGQDSHALWTKTSTTDLPPVVVPLPKLVRAPFEGPPVSGPVME